jgi:hypothetical protein
MHVDAFLMSMRTSWTATTRVGFWRFWAMHSAAFAALTDHDRGRRDPYRRSGANAKAEPGYI